MKEYDIVFSFSHAKEGKLAIAKLQPDGSWLAWLEECPAWAMKGETAEEALDDLRDYFDPDAKSDKAISLREDVIKQRIPLWESSCQ